MFSDVKDLQKNLKESGYLINEENSTIVYLAIKMQKPLLVER